MLCKIAHPGNDRPGSCCSGNFLAWRGPQRSRPLLRSGSGLNTIPAITYCLKSVRIYVRFFCLAGRFACISIIQSLYQNNGSIRFQCACRGVWHRFGDEKASFHDLSTVFYRSGSNPSRYGGPPPRHASRHDRGDGCGALRASRDPDFVPTCRLSTDTTQTVSIARSLLCCP